MKVGLLVAFGKTIALAGPDSGRPSSSGIANIYGFKEVTPEFVGYTAMLVSFVINVCSRTLMRQLCRPTTHCHRDDRSNSPIPRANLLM